MSSRTYEFVRSVNPEIARVPYSTFARIPLAFIRLLRSVEITSLNDGSFALSWYGLDPVKNDELCKVCLVLSMHTYPTCVVCSPGRTPRMVETTEAVTIAARLR